MLKLKMMLCVMMSSVVVGCIDCAVCQSVKLPRPPAWIMQPPPDWQTPLNGIISPQREADHYAKTTCQPRSILMSSAESCPYRWQLMQLL